MSSRTEKYERNIALCNDSDSGMSRDELCKKYSLSSSRISIILGMRLQRKRQRIATTNVVQTGGH